MTKPILSVSNLSMKYPGRDQLTLSDISITINPGEALGFIGRNGSGKSTTIKCITGILNFLEGQIKIGDYDILKDPIKAKQLIGYNSDNHAVYEEMTGREYVLFIASIFNAINSYKANFDSYIQAFELTDSIDKKIASYSHGMKQKISLIATMIHNPELWILDEPFTGLDIVASYYLKEFLNEHKKANRAIFLTSHDLKSIVDICDKVIIIDEGKIIEQIDLKNSPNLNNLEEYFYSKLKIIKDKEC